MKTALGFGKGYFLCKVQKIQKCERVHTYCVWPNVRVPTAECVSNTQLKHACEIKYFGSVKVQTARGFKLCRLTVQADNNT